MNTKIFLILVLSLSIFGCSDGPNTVLPDGGIFADSDVSPDLSVEDDLGVEIDSDVPPVDLGVDTAVPDDLGVVEDSAVADLGTLDLGPDVSVPDDLGTPDVGVDSGPVVVDYFPPGENVYYVWVSGVSWSSYAEAESLCVGRGGHVPTYGPGFSSIPGLDYEVIQTDFQNSIDDSISNLFPYGITCEWNVEDPDFECPGYINNACPLFDSVRCNECRSEITSSACLFQAELPTTEHVTYAVYDGPIDFFYTYNAFGIVNSDTNVPTSDIICLIPESGDFSTGISVSPTYTRVLSSYYTTFNAL